MNKRASVLFFICVVLLIACKQNKVQFNPSNVEIIHTTEKKLTETIIYDIFSPPVASRIYAYTSLAQYEAVRYLDANSSSVITSLNNFPALPAPEKNKEYNFILAGTKAFCTVAYNIKVFAKDSLQRYEDSLLMAYKEVLPQDVYARSVAFGDTIGKLILKRASTDRYKETRGMPRYTGIAIKNDGKWKPTSPDYLDAAEPYWNKINSFSLDSASQFRPGPPPAFSKDSNSIFYKMIKEVYTTGIGLTAEQKEIARFWDDNPFVLEHAGHMMYGNKKITPGGHWMGIAAIACHKANAGAVKTSLAYSLTAIALLDAFISCWDAKFTYDYVRPITIINEAIDKGWEPFLQTPAFPEYTSGHSTITGSAATVLTRLFGDNFSYLDDSDKEYIGMTRPFTSFLQAAAEASVSRLYGGIHYRISLDTGMAKGKLVGEHLLQRVKM